MERIYWRKKAWNKPFECVGTRSEVLASLKYLVRKHELPLLVRRYQDFIVNHGVEIEGLLEEWCDNHEVPELFLGGIRDCLTNQGELI